MSRLKLFMVVFIAAFLAACVTSDPPLPVIGSSIERPPTKQKFITYALPVKGGCVTFEDMLAFARDDVWGSSCFRAPGGRVIAVVVDEMMTRTTDSENRMWEVLKVHSKDGKVWYSIRRVGQDLPSGQEA